MKNHGHRPHCPNRIHPSRSALRSGSHRTLSLILCLALGLALGAGPDAAASRLRAADEPQVIEGTDEVAAPVVGTEPSAEPAAETSDAVVATTKDAWVTDATTTPETTPSETAATTQGASTLTAAASSTAPGAVQNVTAEATGPHSVLLRWTPNDSEFYALYRVTDEGLRYLTVVPGARQTFEDRGAQPDALNRYLVYGYNLGPEGQKLFGPASQVVSATPSSDLSPEEPIQLDPVQGLRARAFASNSNNLRWSRHPEADAYAIFRRVGKSGPLEYVYYVTGDRLQFSDLHAPNEVFTFYWVFPVKHLEGQRVFGPAGRYVYARASRYLGMKALDGPLTVVLDPGAPGLYDFEIPEGHALTLRVQNAQGQTLSQQSLGHGAGQTPSLRLHLKPGDRFQLIGEGRVYCQKVKDGSPVTVDRSGLYYAGDDLGTGTWRAKLTGGARKERGWIRLWDPLDPSKNSRPNALSESLVSGVREAIEFTLRQGQILDIENLTKVVLEWLR